MAPGHSWVEWGRLVGGRWHLGGDRLLVDGSLENGDSLEDGSLENGEPPENGGPLEDGILVLDGAETMWLVVKLQTR